ncbi:MAG: hypothetical protein CL920_24445 [Deltaproteobacteria bacterium]|nr:hypothetical protein [Deltaproteobacteria bacterium]|tara:strand:- start:10235 stop:10885 length:651 start_codon:yes stop_codon:yes gene_type:complete
MGVDEILAALRNRSLSIEEALRQDAITPIVHYEFAYRSVESALLQAMEYGYDVQNEFLELVDLFRGWIEGGVTRLNLEEAIDKAEDIEPVGGTFAFRLGNIGDLDWFSFISSLRAAMISSASSGLESGWAASRDVALELIDSCSTCRAPTGEAVPSPHNPELEQLRLALISTLEEFTCEQSRIMSVLLGRAEQLKSLIGREQEKLEEVLFDEPGLP